MNKQNKVKEGTIIQRLGWCCTMLTFAAIALISPVLLKKALKDYREDEIYMWWKQNNDLTMIDQD